VHWDNALPSMSFVLADSSLLSHEKRFDIEARCGFTRNFERIPDYLKLSAPLGHLICVNINVKVKWQAVKAHTVETSKIAHFLDNQLTGGGEVASLARRSRFTPQENSW
jgi:hypothetical protein